MLLKTAQALLASAALGHAVVVTMKPITDPYSIGKAEEKRETIQLKPIHDLADLIPGHPRRRAVEGNQNLDPADAHSFYWATQLTDNVYVANFTMEAPGKKEKLVPIENFADRLKSIKCDNSSIVIEFTSNDCFEYASSVWDWVNKDKENKMTLVTKAGQCDPDQDRDPFSVSDAKFDKNGLKATLSAKRLTWEKAAHDYTLKTYQQSSSPKPQQKRYDLESLQKAAREAEELAIEARRLAIEASQKQKEKRGFNPLDKVTDAVDDGKKKADEAAQKAKEASEAAAKEAEKAAQEAKKKADEEAKKAAEESKKQAEEAKRIAEEAAKINIGENREMNIDFKIDQTLFDYEKSKHGMAVKASAEVKTSGKLLLDVDIQVSGDEIKKGKMTLRPKGLKTSMVLGLTADGKIGKNPIKFELPKVTIPVAAISIPNIIHLGPKIEGSIFVGSSTLEGKATASIGGKAVFPDDAIMSIDIVNKDGNTAKGWEPKFEKIDPQFSASLEGGVRTGISLAIGLEASIIKKIGAEAVVEADAPFIEATMKVEKNTLGVCGGKKTTGVKFGARAGFNVHLEAGLKAKPPVYAQSLFPFLQEKTWDLPWNQCLAFGDENANASGTIKSAKGKASKTKGPAAGTGKAAATGKDKKPKSTKSAGASITSAPSGAATPTQKPSSNVAKPSSNGASFRTNATMSAKGSIRPTTLITSVRPTASPAGSEDDLGEPSDEGDEVPVDGEDEVPTDGEDEVPTDGEDEVPTDGEDEVPADGEDEVPVDGEDEVPVDGEDELPVDGDDEVPVDGDDEVPVDGDDEVPVDGEDEIPADETDGEPSDETDGQTSDEANGVIYEEDAEAPL
ncbi:hypothetical protein DM02DRAFT_628768 [Periconia macrospinosa]|uniref:Uncharacterized protein n=1 Tax=Periconia macrospinosa TaxID=97972 RepID=A0A2V1DS46_9PLEO|nr:hypothetical protein DM02DRAFT_628768 [Periconia macrospinosa]